MNFLNITKINQILLTFSHAWTHHNFRNFNLRQTVKFLRALSDISGQKSRLDISETPWISTLMCTQKIFSLWILIAYAKILSLIDDESLDKASLGLNSSWSNNLHWLAFSSDCNNENHRKFSKLEKFLGTILVGKM